MYYSYCLTRMHLTHYFPRRGLQCTYPPLLWPWTYSLVQLWTWIIVTSCFILSATPFSDSWRNYDLWFWPHAWSSRQGTGIPHNMEVNRPDRKSSLHGTRGVLEPAVWLFCRHLLFWHHVVGDAVLLQTLCGLQPQNALSLSHEEWRTSHNGESLGCFAERIYKIMLESWLG